MPDARRDGSIFPPYFPSKAETGIGRAGIMSGPKHNIVQLRKVRQQRAEGKTLCTSGFHKWQALSNSRFDVKQGKLVTPERCTRCGKERVRLA
jgi:hypothetical protein